VRLQSLRLQEVLHDNVRSRGVVVEIDA